MKILNKIVITLTLVLFVHTQTFAADKPNIVYFLSDDHSLRDTGVYGNTTVKTPNIDKLAAEGMLFQAAYTPTAMCAPSRSATYTGMYPHRNGCHANHCGINKGVKPLAAYMKAQGYRVALAGKTHFKPKAQFEFHHIRFIGDNPASRRFDWSRIQTFITADDTQPFVLFMASNDPHAPHVSSGTFTENAVEVAPYQVNSVGMRRSTAAYYNDIERMDKEVKQIRDMLKDTKLSDNTAFFYAADHGYGPYAKWTTYEGGLRVPFMVSWPGKIKAGSTTDALISVVDVLPTMVELAGGTPPRAPAEIDGVSFLSVLTAGANSHHDYIFGAHTNRGILSGKAFPSRSVRGKQFKLLYNPCTECMNQNVLTHNHYVQRPSHAIGEWQTIAKTDLGVWERTNNFLTRPEYELYDLTVDPWELNNMIEMPAMKPVIDTLKAQLRAWMTQQGDRGLGTEMTVALVGPTRNAGADPAPWTSMPAKPAGTYGCPDARYKEYRQDRDAGDMLLCKTRKTVAASGSVLPGQSTGPNDSSPNL